ncbi:hypothetical protein FE257_008554 [Aspergillus nanangensis]|uniref:Uncharacterized protein n=1 Tax=Aspergillus nanangensis TaxID=2582783 RepID=A0AAD4CLN6_ASPNN|nr:hypothetical protein FE257_008554 [Aspergillus nanangensis]
MAALSFSQTVKSLSDEGLKASNLLDTYCQPSNNTTPASVAEEINRLAQGILHSAEPDIEEFLWEVWKVFITIAKQIPSDHESQERLVGVIAALTELCPTTIQIWGSDIRLWKDLPLLGPSMREAWISPTIDHTTPSEKPIEEWINLNSFAARLLARDYASWIQFPVWALRSALEEESSGAELDCNATVAAEWILQSAVQIYEKIATSPGEKEDRAMSVGPLYKGPQGVCPERWNFWKKRFGEIAGGQGVAGDKAVKAREVMERVERGA